LDRGRLVALLLERPGEGQIHERRGLGVFLVAAGEGGEAEALEAACRVSLGEVLAAEGELRVDVIGHQGGGLAKPVDGGFLAALEAGVGDSQGVGDFETGGVELRGFAEQLDGLVDVAIELESAAGRAI
jgi:hypothetical protein